MSNLLPHPVIAIDGPAASGKSTFGRQLAARLGYAFISTGSMYRGITWYVRYQGIDWTNSAAIAQNVTSVPVATTVKDGELSFLINGIDPLPHIRDASVNEGVSIVAKVPEVRHLLVSQQQQLALVQPLVMEGRDIGTVVFPQTPYKFYLDADPAIRASRRAQQGETDSVLKRDALDQQRAASPLTCANNAKRLDSGIYTVEQLLEQALEHLQAQGFQ